MQKKQTGKKTAAPRRSPLPFLLIVAVLLAAVGAGAWYLSRSRQPGAVAAGLPGAQPAHSEGSESAPVVLEEFGDFQCPPCGQMFPEVERIRQDYGDRLRFVFREYPLVNIHPHALRAAHAAEAAGLQGKFWEMERELFADQLAWSRAQDPTALFESYARRSGLDVDRFRRDLGGAETDARVVADRERAKSVGVESTPTFFINGRKVGPAQDMGKALRAEIDRALGK
ncbi:MAG TPA: thioredoxin domain-containing protein [Pyrinomonadaceae bacterium]|jgi:protein-disulfide isomerase|nr:thioredoxin domain-containing protein [Pyrinomonadaceae bacterium]